MNIFYLDNNPKICAQYHVDRHCVKMILEYAQLLSTAHRCLDGWDIIKFSKAGRRTVHKKLMNDMDEILYSATHINHPSAIWTRQCASNYRWLFELWTELLDEYTYRYGKEHASSRLLPYLAQLPQNISTLEQFSEPTPAMPEQYIVKNNSLQSYKNYYNSGKKHLHNWKKRSVPDFITE